MSKSILTRQQKFFRTESVCPFDANNISLDEAMAKLFIYLRTGSQKIVKTSKAFYIAEDQAVPSTLIDILLQEKPQNFHGFSDAARKNLLSAWVGSHFAIMTRSREMGKQRITGMRPLHFAIIKLFNPKVRSQDRYLSDFFFNALKDDPALTSNPDSLFRQFFGVGVRNFGNTDFQVDEAELAHLVDNGGIDIELLFLLRLLEPFDADTYSLDQKDRAASFAFLCPEQIALMKQDLRLLFLYKGKIPRRELINYMMSLLAFHAALYFFQVVSITNYMVREAKLPPPRGPEPKPGEARSNAPFKLDFFCDLTSGHDAKVKELAERRYTEHFKDVEQYFRSAYIMKKLEEFAGAYLTSDQKQKKGREYVSLLLSGFLKHKDIDGYFAREINQVQENAKDPETGEYNPEIARLIEVGNERKQSKLHTFVDILCHFQHDQLRDQHRKLISSLCGFEQDRGFLAGVGRGRSRRRYVLGNELLEVLIQLAVLRKRESDQKWYSKEIEIGDFVNWLQERYGLLIDSLGQDSLAVLERKLLFQLFLQRASSYKEEAEFYIASDQPLNEFVVDEELSAAGSRRLVHLQRQLTRSQYEEISGRFFLDHGDLNIFRPIGQALDVAASIVPGFRKEHVDLVLYTGGASRMLGIKAALETYFAPTECYSITDEEACNTVALGAASCRYDQQNGQRGVVMTSRLLESILIRDEDAGTCVPVVPLTCEPSTEFKPVGAEFHVRRPAVTLRLPLFRGVGPMDHHLMPMQDLVLRLPAVVASGVPYKLFYRMTENKTVQLRALFSPDAGVEFEVDGEVDIDASEGGKSFKAVPLARIN